MVLGQCRPVARPQLSSLSVEPQQVGLVADFVGTHAAHPCPDVLPLLQFGCREHPLQHLAGLVDTLAEGEDGRCLQVGVSGDVVHVDATFFCPLGKRFSEERHFAVVQVATKLVVKSVGTHHECLFAHGHHIDTLPRQQVDVPRILRHARDDILMRQRPCGRHAAVFNPQVAVVGSDAHLGVGILHKHGGMWFQRVVHDFALVVDQILYGHCRREQFVCSTEMVKLTSCERQYCHLELVQFFINHCRFCP